MIDSCQRRKLRFIILLFSVSLIAMGIGGYYYLIKDKKPTHGIFVHHIEGGELISGHLYQPS